MTDREKLIEAIARALMEVTALPPADTRGVELPILDLDPDYDDLPLDHTQGTSDDPITQEAVRKLAEAALTALAEQGYAIVPVKFAEVATECEAISRSVKQRQENIRAGARRSPFKLSQEPSS